MRGVVVTIACVLTTTTIVVAVRSAAEQQTPGTSAAETAQSALDAPAGRFVPLVVGASVRVFDTTTGRFAGPVVPAGPQAGTYMPISLPAAHPGQPPETFLLNTSSGVILKLTGTDNHWQPFSKAVP
jgi:hypothetical protein